MLLNQQVRLRPSPCMAPSTFGKTPLTGPLAPLQANGLLQGKAKKAGAVRGQRLVSASRF